MQYDSMVIVERQRRSRLPVRGLVDPWLLRESRPWFPTILGRAVPPDSSLGFVVFHRKRTKGPDPVGNTPRVLTRHFIRLYHQGPARFGLSTGLDLAQLNTSRKLLVLNEEHPLCSLALSYLG